MQPMAFTVLIFTKLILGEQDLMEIFYTKFHPYHLRSV